MFPIGLSTTTFRQEAQEAPSVTAIFTDISDLKEVQELHMRAERLEAVAELSASLAHEIRNPLASIRSSVEQLARSKHADDDERFLAGLIVRESDRLSRLLSEFLDFARVRATHFAPVDLHSVVVAVVRLIRAHPDCRPDAVITRRGRAYRARGRRGSAAPRGRQSGAQRGAGGPGPDSDHRHRRRRPGIRDSARDAISSTPVRLQVRDNGPGIPEEVRERLFQPFVSGRSGGSGLGLAIVQRAVEAHRGLVLVDSGPGSGTTFTIFLPAKMVGGGCCMSQKPSVLVVDDESGILDTLRILLRNEGFEVTTAQGGKAGLEQIRSGTHDIVLSDVRMPQVSGSTSSPRRGSRTR